MLTDMEYRFWLSGLDPGRLSVVPFTLADSVAAFESADLSEGSEVGGVREPPVEVTELSASLFGTSTSALDAFEKVPARPWDCEVLFSLSRLDEENRRRSLRKEGIMLPNVGERVADPRGLLTCSEGGRVRGSR
jgi:hypothetical protein